jgi:hypothetical protein
MTTVTSGTKPKPPHAGLWRCPKCGWKYDAPLPHNDVWHECPHYKPAKLIRLRPAK